MDSDKLARYVSIGVIAIRVLTNFKWWLFIVYAGLGYGLYWSLRTPADVVTGKEYIRVWMSKEWKGIIIGIRMEKVHRDEPDKYNYFVTFSVIGFFFFLYVLVNAI